ncbi:Pentatricopeptide repeat-containing protein [Thalictrum thalictroides]|uniref:Pentatricopeptide repeat-containing protein n=1 Tax=Thalictrum thalictroides TaxID=46969 RepID=A0A7J6WDN8_THATH|nr:Pentatricopeptide repeat-containing protein [Thalictrum thalictroides]
MKLGLDIAVYSTLISGLFKAGRKGEVVGVLEEMGKTGCKPNTVTYNALIFGYCNEKDFELAFLVLKEIVEKGYKPDVISYNVISALCKGGKLQQAIDLFEEMPRRDCVLDVVTYRTIFDGFC